MTDTRQRLMNCFQSVFPNLTKEAIAGATRNSLLAWDSLATVNLLTLVSDEFGLEMDFEDLDHYDSFETIYQYVVSRNGTVPAPYGN